MEATLAENSPAGWLVVPARHQMFGNAQFESGRFVGAADLVPDHWVTTGAPVGDDDHLHAIVEFEVMSSAPAMAGNPNATAAASTAPCTGAGPAPLAEIHLLVSRTVHRLSYGQQRRRESGTSSHRICTQTPADAAGFTAHDRSSGSKSGGGVKLADCASSTTVTAPSASQPPATAAASAASPSSLP